MQKPNGDIPCALSGPQLRINELTYCAIKINESLTMVHRGSELKNVNYRARDLESRCEQILHLSLI